jgi:hypothetical protein
LHNYEHKKLIEEITKLDEVPTSSEFFSERIQAAGHLEFPYRPVNRIPGTGNRSWFSSGTGATEDGTSGEMANRTHFAFGSPSVVVEAVRAASQR